MCLKVIRNENEKRLFHQFETTFSVLYEVFFYNKNPNKIPAATADPITPATLGPIACINR